MERSVLNSPRVPDPEREKVGDVDTSAGNAGVRPAGSRAAPPTSEYEKRRACHYHTRIALLIIGRASEHVPNDEVDSALALAVKALNEALRRLREG